MIGKQPDRTKEELVQFGNSIGQQPKDIAEALAEAGLEWDPSPDAWNEITNAVSMYAEQLETAEV